MMRYEKWGAASNHLADLGPILSKQWWGGDRSKFDDGDIRLLIQYLQFEVQRIPLVEKEAKEAAYKDVLSVLSNDGLVQLIDSAAGGSDLGKYLLSKHHELYIKRRFLKKDARP